LSTRVADAGVDRMLHSHEKVSYAEQLNKEAYIKVLDQEMEEAAAEMDFEKAALLRDEIFELKTSE
jgi:excinuclease UvrABC helicase subunit UvrB